MKSSFSESKLVQLYNEKKDLDEHPPYWDKLVKLLIIEGAIPKEED